MTQKKFEAKKMFWICKMTIKRIVSGHYGPVEERFAVMKNRMMFFKKTWILALALLLLGTLSACGAPVDEGADSRRRGLLLVNRKKLPIPLIPPKASPSRSRRTGPGRRGRTSSMPRAARRSMASTACPPWVPISPRSFTRRWWSTMRKPASSQTSRRRRA